MKQSPALNILPLPVHLNVLDRQLLQCVQLNPNQLALNLDQISDHKYELYGAGKSVVSINWQLL